MLSKSVLKATLMAAVVLGGSAHWGGARAGGLFGEGGLFRGSIGNALDKHIERPITTPLARSGAVVGGAVAGGAAAVANGADPRAGVEAGASVGVLTNEAFKGTFSR